MSTNHDENTGSSKRQRISRACNYCRLRKSKCDGAEPTCSNCETHGQECIYSASTKKRGLQVGHLRLLIKHQSLSEGALGFLVSSVDGVEATLTHFLHRITENPEEVESLQQVWKKSSAYSTFQSSLDIQHDEISFSGVSLQPEGLTSGHIEGRLSKAPGPRAPSQSQPTNSRTQATDLIPQFSLENTRSSAYASDSYFAASPQSGPVNSTFAGSDTEWQAFAAAQDSTADAFDPNNALNISDGRITQLGRPSQVPKDLNQHRNVLQMYRQLTLLYALESSTLPIGAPDLLESYFLRVHPFFPLANKIELLQFLHKSQASRPKHHQGQLDAKASQIWSACALASHIEQAVHIEGKNHLVPRANIYALQFVASEDFEPNEHKALETIEVLLFLSLSLLQDQCWDTARDVISMACNAALRYQLFATPSQLNTAAKLPNGSCNRKRKAWATCFLLDILISIILDVSPVIYAGSYNVPCIDEDGGEEWDTWILYGTHTLRKSPARIASAFNQLLRLAHILNGYLCATISYQEDQQANRSEISMGAIRQAHQKLSKDLQSWLSTMPGHLQSEMVWDRKISSQGGIASVADPAPYTIGLSLAYHAFVSYSCRRMLAKGPEIFQDGELPNPISLQRLLVTSSSIVYKISRHFSSRFGSTVMNPFQCPLIHISNLRATEHHGKMRIPSRLFPTTAGNVSFDSTSHAKETDGEYQARFEGQQAPIWKDGTETMESSQRKNDSSKSYGRASPEDPGGFWDTDLLNYESTNVPQFLEFMDKLGFPSSARPGHHTDSTQNEENVGSLELIETDTWEGLSTMHLEGILDTWMDAATQP
ncbi:unnamed protein product [Clonostachys byssicola]|uniref:Zn(2)-C6 fungal-type domain-containing protein n=1 Tax=Clonostachys byssicola TaxID=160290 RepID=A0A9N9Y618_9HYPO|nr:unnamed protein product [Clonostachys byssicola]